MLWFDRKQQNYVKQLSFNLNVNTFFKKKLTQASQPPPSEGRQKKQEEAVSQQLKQKPYYRKLIMMKKQKVMSQMKGEGETPEKQLNEVEMGHLPGKELRIMTVKMIQGLGKNGGKD